jgi:hypothetical protein
VPIPDDAVPIPDDAVPILDDAVPIPDDAVPIPDDAVPSPDDAVPILENALCVRRASQGRLSDAPSVLRAPPRALDGPEATRRGAPRARADRMRFRMPICSLMQPLEG